MTVNKWKGYKRGDYYIDDDGIPRRVGWLRALIIKLLWG